MSNKNTRYNFKCELKHDYWYKNYSFLTRNMLANFLGIEREELDRLRPRGFILNPTGKTGRAPKWSRKEVVDWLRAGSPSRNDWEEIKRQRKSKGE